MSRRCKAGQRARIINGSNKGKVVLVVRRYMGEVIEGGKWPNALFPWVVTTLGAPLLWASLDGTREGTASTIVVDDRDLEPLKDGDDGLRRSVEKAAPIVAQRSKVTT
jgi:hypothetical protein